MLLARAWFGISSERELRSWSGPSAFSLCALCKERSQRVHEGFTEFRIETILTDLFL